jgi:surface polysaccharide O-acyltransferase-like enzyme
MLIVFGPFAWLTLGPFGIQPSRLLHYAFYFFVGVGVGAYGLGRGPLAEASLLVRHWGRWAIAAALLHLFFATALYPLVGALAAASPFLGLLLYGLAFVVTSAATSIALLAVFQRFLTRRNGAGDSLAANSYGIYIVHYVVVLWAQYLLLEAPLPAVIKGLTVFAIALALSWSCSGLARRRPFLFERGSPGARSVPETTVGSETNG